MFCSLRDFLIWNEFWNGTPLVSDDLLSQALVRPKLNDGSPSHYGFGWVIARQPGRAWHNGAWLGARTYIIRDAASKRCLVVLDDSLNQRAATIASSIQSQLFTSNARYSVAPRVSPFTEVCFDDEQVIVTYDGQTYQWLELDGFKVEDIVASSKLQFGDNCQKSVAENLVDVLWRMDHRPGDTVKLRLLELETKQDVVIANAPMTKENRFAVSWKSGGTPTRKQLTRKTMTRSTIATWRLIRNFVLG